MNRNELGEIIKRNTKFKVGKKVWYLTYNDPDMVDDYESYELWSVTHGEVLSVTVEVDQDSTHVRYMVDGCEYGMRFLSDSTLFETSGEAERKRAELNDKAFLYDR